MIALAVRISLKLDTVKMQRLIFTCLLIVVISGLGFYGFGLSSPEDTIGQLMINAFKTVAYTISMFGGGEKFDTLMKVNGWFANNVVWQIIYWLVHLLAVFVTASAVLITWGKKLLSRIKLMIPDKDLCILYCDNDRKIDYVAQLEQKGYRILYIGEFSKELNNKLSEYRVGFIADKQVKKDGKWLKPFLLLRKNTMNIQVICVSQDDSKAVNFLRTLFDSFTSLKVSTRNVKAHILGKNVVDYAFVSDLKDYEGYRYITEVYAIGEMAAHELVRKARPYETMKFDYETCKAQNDFNAMIIGFGDVGQDVLRYLIRYSQFLGSTFSAEVYDVDIDNCGGLFREMYSDMIERYNVSFHSLNAFGAQIYQNFSEKHKLNYIVACTGDDETNRQIINNLQTYRQIHGECFTEKSVIACASKTRIEVLFSDGHVEYMKTADIDDFIDEKVNMTARHINDVYYLSKAGYSQTELTDLWYKKDPIDRLSSVAAAEYLDTFFACSNSWGLSRKELEKKINDSLSKILPELEHMRWNAFESTIGVSQMSREEFQNNIDRCLKLTEKAIESGSDEDLSEAEKQFAITRKDLGPYGLGGRHACLADWDELPELWKMYEPMLTRYNELMSMHGKKTTRAVDFQMLDVKNIYHMLDVIDR